MEMKKITEEIHLEEEWFDDAKKQTLDTLPEFVRHIMNDYEHDYGTVCHAISACALAAAWAADKSDGAQGGITGFQAGFVMWDFIRKWMYTSNKCGLRIVDYDNMLYPQYEDDYDKVIPQRIWQDIQEEAWKRLQERDDAHPDVKEHWQSIVDGKVPFGFRVKED